VLRCAEELKSVIDRLEEFPFQEEPDATRPFPEIRE
jgi:hypothetical protein